MPAVKRFRAREYEDALQWLVDAGLVHKVFRNSAPRLPIAAYDDLTAFKIYLADTGLLRRLAQLSPTAFGEGNRLFMADHTDRLIGLALEHM